MTPRLSLSYLFQLVLLLGTLLLSPACSKDDAAPTTGAIKGVVDPADAVLSVSVFDATSSAGITVTPNSDNGAFSVANLAPGNYTVQFATSQGYDYVPDRSVSVAAGQTNDLGTIRTSRFVGGTVEGTIQPAGSIRYLSLSPVGTTNGTTVMPDATGFFRFASVAAGSYVLEFAPESGYLAPEPQRITATSGATTDLGTINVSSSGPSSTTVSGSMRWDIVTNRYTASTVTGSIILTNGVPSNLTLRGTATTANNGSNIVTVNTSLYSPIIGLYTLGGYPGGTASCLMTSGGVPTGNYVTSNGTAGTVTITAYDAVARTISGTFGFSAYETQYGYSLQVSNGSFSLTY